MQFYQPLTPAENKVLPYIAAGFTNTRIADILGMRSTTISGTRQRIYNKFGLGIRESVLPITLAYMRDATMCAECYPNGTLTHTEQALLDNLSRYVDIKKLADELGIMAGNVQEHLDDMYKKFRFTSDVNRRVALCVYSLTTGALSSETITPPGLRVLRKP